MSYLVDIVDKINMCRCKISFLSDFFSNSTSIELNTNSQSGLGFFLDEITESFRTFILCYQFGMEMLVKLQYPRSEIFFTDHFLYFRVITI